MPVTATLLREGAVGVLWFDAPPHNLLDRRLSLLLADAVAELPASPSDLAALVLYGGEKIFSAGADPTGVPPGGVEAPSRHAARAIVAIHDFAATGRPVVAAITGHALGAGLNVAGACDVRVAGDNIRAGRTAALPGIHPASEVLRRGVVDRLVAPDDVYDEAVAAARAAAVDPSLRGAFDRVPNPRTE